MFARRGAVVTSTVPAGILTTATAKAVPSGLPVAIVTGSSAASLTTITIMSWINAKSVAAMAAAALLAGTAGYMAQKQKLDQLQAKADAALAQLDEAKAAAQTAQQALAARERQLQDSGSNSLELARARNQITPLAQQQQQLQRERDAAVRAAAAAPTAAVRTAAPTAFPPGTYINRTQLSGAGFASPEATIQTLAWAAVNGETNLVAQAVSAAFPQAEQFAAQLQQALLAAAPVFQGVQVMAEKSIADGRVELLVKVDVVVPAGVDPRGLPPNLNVVGLVRENNEWKMGAQPQDYSPDWQKTGQIRTFAQ